MYTTKLKYISMQDVAGQPLQNIAYETLPLIVLFTISFFPEAQGFCFLDGATDCTTGVPVPSPSVADCCHVLSRGGRGGGSYSASGTEGCINCMTVVGNYAGRNYY